MLLQSHAGEINILPARPDAWKNGFIKGIKARGDIGVDLEWGENKSTTVVLNPGKNCTQKIRPPKDQKIKNVLEDENKISVLTHGDGTSDIIMKAGKKYSIMFN